MDSDYKALELAIQFARHNFDNHHEGRSRDNTFSHLRIRMFSDILESMTYAAQISGVALKFG